MDKGNVMKWRRLIVLLTLVHFLAPTALIADEYPSRPVRVIVPFSPGGPVDVLARALGEGFRQRTGQPLVIENRAGANTLIGASACKAAAPDGYTICILSMTTMSLNPFLYSSLPYNADTDFEPITNAIFTRQLLILNSSVPAQTFAEVVEYSKKAPGGFNFASFGIGSESQLVLEWLKKLSGANFAHVPFPGAAPGLMAFARGDVQLFYLVASPSILEQIRTGTARGLLVPGTQRNPDLPEVPTYKDAGLPVLDSKNWFGLFAPGSTPKPLVDKMATELRAVIHSPEFQDKYVKVTRSDAVGNSPEEFRAFLQADRGPAQELVAAAGVKIDR